MPKGTRLALPLNRGKILMTRKSGRTAQGDSRKQATEDSRVHSQRVSQRDPLKPLSALQQPRPVDLHPHPLTRPLAEPLGHRSRKQGKA